MRRVLHWPQPRPRHRIKEGWNHFASSVERWRHYQPWLGELAGLAELQDC
jgi:hypothetical protein